MLASGTTLSNLGEDLLRGAERSSRNLELLRAIDTTIERLCYDQRYFSQMAKLAKEVTDDVLRAPKESVLDSTGSGEKDLLAGQEAIHELHQELIQLRQSAIEDPRLTDDDGVADEYGRTIQIVAETHNAINTLRWVVKEHDANVRSMKEPPLKTYKAEEIEQLISDLKE